MSPSSMKAAVYRRFGGPEVVTVETVPRPEPADNELLIRVHASTVSIADYRLRTKDLPKGLGIVGPLAFGIVRPRRQILGMDFAGVVEKVGSAVTLFAPGDRVIGEPSRASGGHAEYLVIAEDATVTLAPSNLSLEDAASLVFGGLTMSAFYNAAPPTAGARVLVNGASGSTGTAAVQLAAAAGAHVTGVSSAGNHDFVRSLGAAEMIDYATTDFATTASEKYDIIVDCVGNAGYSRVASILKPGGALLMVISGLGGMMTARRDSRRLGGVVTATPPGGTAADLSRVVELAEAGQFVPVIERVYSLDEITDAHRRVGEWRKRGNLVLKLA
ncbi:MAG: NAD(P)-dependent alcohol dehydrogenase [Rhodoglobus sp.]